MISHRQGFYVSPTEPHANDLDAAAIQLLPHAYESPATVRGSAQLIPRSKFFGEGVAILNFRLRSLDVDAGDLGGILKGFAAAFFGGTDKAMLVFEHIEFDLDINRRGHMRKMEMVVKNLRAARYVHRTVVHFRNIDRYSGHI